MNKGQRIGINHKSPQGHNMFSGLFSETIQVCNWFYHKTTSINFIEIDGTNIFVLIFRITYSGFAAEFECVRRTTKFHN